MHGRARFTPSCAQRCRSARPLSRQAAPVVASRIALQRLASSCRQTEKKEAVVHLATVKKLQLLNRHGIGQTTCHWLRMCLLDLAQPASSLLRGSQWKMHGRARFTPSCAQRCRSTRPLSRQDQPVLASRIALQRSGEQLWTNGE